MLKGGVQHIDSPPTPKIFRGIEINMKAIKGYFACNKYFQINLFFCLRRKPFGTVPLPAFTLLTNV
jgi:hypothetical protein